ncbi:hypothetical protein Pint_20159 [Pistacia integerrima]|uniref:Uncharacterized protein n=1 Tax=Pistacia integerrima TaxID=434235 RepID=A0ACC0XEE1_9ROSI|nr:hypothetical protein Pint_20159 [Pistacia integerrima]
MHSINAQMNQLNLLPTTLWSPPINHIAFAGFTGIDDPYEPPLNCEIEIKQKDGVCPPPGAMAGQVVTYLEEKGYLHDQ